MREIRSPLDGILSPFAARAAAAVDAYAVQGLSPLLVADFTTPYYRKAGSTSTFDSTFTHSRLGNATMVDSDGLIKWAPHNLALNSAAPATQSITVVSGADYTVEITGSGSVALTGAGTGTVTAGNPVEITASTTTLTLTVTGTPSTMWAYRSDLGGMVNNPDTGNSYVPTTSAAVYQARRNHHTYNGTSWINSGLLLETEARTNLIQYSENFFAWVTGGASVGAAVVSPTGASDASSLVEASGLSTHIRYIAVSGTTQCVLSCFAKAGTRTAFRIACNAGNTPWAAAAYDLSSGTATAAQSAGDFSATSDIQNVGGGWYRCILYVSSVGAPVQQAKLGPSDVTNPTFGSFGDYSYSGDGVSDVKVYGFQLEAGATPSSYMPNYGTVAGTTRPTESLQIAAADMPWDASNVSLQMNGKITYADEGVEAQNTFARWYDDASNYITIDLDTDSTDTGEVNFEQQDGTGGTGTVTADTYSPGILVPYNIASRNTSTAINGATGGTAGTEDTTPTALPDLSAKDFSLGYDYMGTIAQFRAWNVDIGDTGIEDATS